MIFTTPEFVLFALVFFAVYVWLQGRAKSLWLLAASYFFYGCWSLGFLGLLFATSALDYYIGAAIGRTDDEARRKRILTLSIVANLGVLGFFKYANFFIDSVAGGLSAMGLEVQPRVLDIVLPVGISFYTFQSMSYTIDVYRRHLAPARSLADFLLYVTVFPQLVAGPIERATHLLPQVERVGREPMPADHSGWGLIAWGAFKKVVIADNLAPLVELTYHDPSASWGPALWLGTYAFAFQIYCDFSGYSDIAVGVGRLMGLDLMQNFRAPYAADGPSDFWRRWHISLSSWLRDYLYISLGGNRGGEWRTRRNLLLTMLLGGLWHGAAWNFVLWGAFHGVLLVVFRALPARHGHPGALGHVWRVARRVLFFHVVCLSWALFRAESLSDCGTILSGLLGFGGWDVAGWLEQVSASGEGPMLAFLCAVMLALFVAQNVWRTSPDQLVARVWRTPVAVRLAFVVVLLAAAVLFAPETPPPFIYFQF